MIKWILLSAGLLGALVVGLVVYSVWYLRWETRQTTGMAYYGRSLVGRRKLKKQIRLYSGPVRLLVRLLGSVSGQSRAAMPAFEYEGTAGPPKVSSPEVFERAKKYQPRPEDVFVVTQMRCGTTWMQQIVYETVCRGRGDLSDSGHGPLYAISPWIDAVNSVSIADAPLVGERPTRIIKSHLPTTLCPYSTEAKYIYVTRHPVSCFASIVDYHRLLLGPLAPSVDVQVDWFCSDRMYWQPWPKHVEAWWQWAEERDNVLFVHFEDMKADFGATLDRIAAFLGSALTDEERRVVIDKCSFQYMKEHEEAFEMAPPTMFSAASDRFLASGNASRGDDVPPAVRARILEYCQSALKDSGYARRGFYPDLSSPSVNERAR